MYNYSLSITSLIVYSSSVHMSHGHCKLNINNYYSAWKSSVNNYYSAWKTKQLTVKDNESLYLWIYNYYYNYTARTKRFFKWRYFNTTTSCMHACMCHMYTVSFYRRSQGRDKGSIIIVITQRVPFSNLSVCIFFWSLPSLFCRL